MTDIVLKCSGVSKTFVDGDLKTSVLHDVDLEIRAGEMLAITGASGSGKSTLLNMLGGLDLPSEGEVLLMGESFEKLSERKKGLLRNQNLGFVYQFHHLLPEFSAEENVAMPLWIAGEKRAKAISTARELLDQVKLSHRYDHRAGELSGGERQRVAIARALAANPKCVLMDEPTGNLDFDTAEHIHDLIKNINQEMNVSFVVVTHDLSLAERMGRRLNLVEGRVSTDY
ncbi:lipoprotein-releasing ABC transporter ATP-binding protein LolD [Litoribacillus peritrichatus]|uniref:Lipoprotein-releasing system ATP-binding protein LolD n=1 Tax=Litoribacillus peritrichatus TaxID=718191 RepID=A0ABP7N553_9GAMM